MRRIESRIDTGSASYAENRAAYEAMVATLRERQQVAIDGGHGRERSIERHLSRGKVLVRDRIDMVTDHETERARYWLPCVDHPSARTTLDIAITAPTGMEILATGALKQTEDHEDGTTTARWHSAEPCPSTAHTHASAHKSVFRFAHGSLWLGCLANMAGTTRRTNKKARVRDQSTLRVLARGCCDACTGNEDITFKELNRTVRFEDGPLAPIVLFRTEGHWRRALKCLRHELACG